MMSLRFEKLANPTAEIADVLCRWENDRHLVPLTRPNANEEELRAVRDVTVGSLTERIKDHQVFLIYFGEKLIGEMNYQVDPEHLFKKETGTAWIGITIGEQDFRGKGFGRRAIGYLEGEIRQNGLNRVELGVFEFNAAAMKLYNSLGYREIGRLAEFTFWKGKMWQDIRMEKYL